MKRVFAIVLLLLGSSVAVPGEKESEATALIRAAEEHLRGASTQMLMTMVIKRPDFKRVLKLRSWTSGSKNALVEILEPVKEEGVSSLRVDDQMWNYLPKTDQVVRVPTSLMLQSWMGSDFTNDDLMKASSLVRDYEHKIIRTEKLLGLDTILVECTPKPNAPVVWGKIEYWAIKKNRLPVRQRFYDENKKLVRTIDFSKFKKMDDRVIPTLVTVRKAEAAREYTIVSYEKILYDKKINEGIFSRDDLRTNSQQGKLLAGGWMNQPMVLDHPTAMTQPVQAKGKKVAKKNPASRRVASEKDRPIPKAKGEGA